MEIAEIMMAEERYKTGQMGWGGERHYSSYCYKAEGPEALKYALGNMHLLVCWLAG